MMNSTLSTSRRGVNNAGTRIVSDAGKCCQPAAQTSQVGGELVGSDGTVASSHGSLRSKPDMGEGGTIGCRA